VPAGPVFAEPVPHARGLNFYKLLFHRQLRSSDGCFADERVVGAFLIFLQKILEISPLDGHTKACDSFETIIPLPGTKQAPAVKSFS